MRLFLLFVMGAVAITLLLILPLPTYEIPLLHFSKGKDAPEARLVFGGDIQFDRYIRQISEKVGGDYVFSCIDAALLPADAVVANLEGPITHNPSVSMGTDAGEDANYVFTFPPETAPLLARHNIFVVNIGNNHITNFGRAGVDETKAYLTSADVAYFGNEEVLRLTIADVPFTFINYNQFAYDGDTALAIRTAREEGRIPVVYTHWGEEYSPVTDGERELAHQFIDAGAALVIGSHPHIVQDVERYKDTYIYYSLGNFIFDQYFSDEVTHGLLISVTFTGDGVKTIQEIPIELQKDGRTCVTNPVER